MSASKFLAFLPRGFIMCCVEAECPFCYLRDSNIYVHESCCLGYQRHPLTYVGRRRFWYGPLTKYGTPPSCHLGLTVSDNLASVRDCERGCESGSSKWLSSSEIGGC